MRDIIVVPSNHPRMSSKVDEFVMSYNRRAAFAPKENLVPSALLVVVLLTSIIHRCLKGLNYSLYALEGVATYHTPKPFLSCRVPQLQSHFDTVDLDFLRNKESTACRGRILRVKLILGISLQQTRFSNSFTVYEQLHN
jgi:hypothetical protein